MDERTENSGTSYPQFPDHRMDAQTSTRTKQWRAHSAHMINSIPESRPHFRIKFDKK
jgi:hypothetical protein